MVKTYHSGFIIMTSDSPGIQWGYHEQFKPAHMESEYSKPYVSVEITGTIKHCVSVGSLPARNQPPNICVTLV